ncbi:MAG: BLUF domain-containing protein [Beijerinckiaceae bacterium]|nr:BLUF domain-containing protein [Beijerinckiaceae bacterium]
MSLMRLVYASRSRLVEGHRAEELQRIVTSAERLNARNRITGFLLATPGAFAQVLEGAQIDVAETYGRIVTDLRHANIRLLVEQPIVARGFGQWSMGLAERDETTAFIFGLYGVTPENDLIEQPVDTLLELAGELARGRA